MNQEDNKREFFRHQFRIPLCAGLRIAEIGGKRVETGKTLVCVQDVGAGGIRFQSNLQLPVRNDVIFAFTLTMLDKTIELQGTLAWDRKLENNCYEYGLRFCYLSKDKQRELISIVNKVAIIFRKGTGSAECSICSLKTKCFKDSSTKKAEYYLSD
jgi:c-di-GMP-binding flagellar brake protein YcgR